MPSVSVTFSSPEKRRPDMATIYVKTKAGRVAFYEGKPIPHDKFIPVADDASVKRLISHWEDIEVQTPDPPADARRRQSAPPVPTTAKE
jgi:hypothetical protein